MKNSIKFALIYSAIVLVLLVTDVIGLWVFIGLICVLIFTYTIWSDNEGEGKKKTNTHKLQDELNSLSDFNPTKKLICHDNLIAIDDGNRCIAFKEVTGKIHVYPYAAILSCEIIEDGETAYRKSSSIGRAIVGGVIAGGVGAIIGGFSGKERENKEIKYLDLRIVLKDTNNSSFKVRFFDSWEDTYKTKKSVRISDPVDGHKLQKATEQLKYWKDLLEIIIDKIDNEKDALPTKQYSISEELVKLSNLKESGILTEEEFQQQKKKILG